MGWEHIRNCKRCRGDFEFKGKELLCPDCIYKSPMISKRIKNLRKGHAKYLERKEKAKKLRELKRIKNSRKDHAKYLERKEKAKKLRELNKNKLIIFCFNCKEPFVSKINLQCNSVIFGGMVRNQLYEHIINDDTRKYLEKISTGTGRCPKCMGWNYDKNFFNYFKGVMFGKNHELNNFDKALIRARIRLFKIQRKEVTTDETNRI